MTSDAVSSDNPRAVSDQSPSSLAALVTGGSRGIGRAICEEFGRLGWRVGVHYHTGRQEADGTAAEVNRQGGEGMPLQADIRRADQVTDMMRGVVERWGRLDVLICNAGQATGQLLLRMDPTEWKRIIDTNLTGTFLCLQAGARHMQARGRGSIIVVGSFAGAQGGVGQSAYAASKAGLLGLVRSAAREWGRSNVTVNLVLPGRHRTAMSRRARAGSSIADDHVLGRSPSLDEVARTIRHLALLSDVSGQVWNLDSRILP